jgi:hypothetical protein
LAELARRGPYSAEFRQTLLAAGILGPEGEKTREMSDATQIAEHDQNDRARVESWRLHILIEAGYPLPLAERLAQSEADLHRAVELIMQGCEPQTAAEILL